jgi:hypothetical protein
MFCVVLEWPDGCLSHRSFFSCRGRNELSYNCSPFLFSSNCNFEYCSYSSIFGQFFLSIFPSHRAYVLTKLRSLLPTKLVKDNEIPRVLGGSIIQIKLDNYVVPIIEVLETLFKCCFMWVLIVQNRL